MVGSLVFWRITFATRLDLPTQPNIATVASEAL